MTYYHHVFEYNLIAGVVGILHCAQYIERLGKQTDPATTVGSCWSQWRQHTLLLTSMYTHLATVYTLSYSD